MKVIVKHKLEFGKDRFYPENKEARILLLLMHRVSFTREQLEMLKELDSINIGVIQEEITI